MRLQAQTGGRNTALTISNLGTVRVWFQTSVMGAGGGGRGEGGMLIMTPLDTYFY
jgi:hypothetical protein